MDEYKEDRQWRKEARQQNKKETNKDIDFTESLIHLTKAKELYIKQLMENDKKDDSQLGNSIVSNIN